MITNSVYNYNLKKSSNIDTHLTQHIRISTYEYSECVWNPKAFALLLRYQDTAMPATTTSSVCRRWGKCCWKLQPKVTWCKCEASLSLDKSITGSWRSQKSFRDVLTKIKGSKWVLWNLVSHSAIPSYQVLKGWIPSRSRWSQDHAELDQQDLGSVLHSRDWDDRTPLHCAARQGHVEAMGWAGARNHDQHLVGVGICIDKPTLKDVLFLMSTKEGTYDSQQLTLFHGGLMVSSRYLCRRTGFLIISEI